MSLPLTLDIDGRTWRTPLTAPDIREHGGARLVPKTYSRGGYWRMEGTRGYEFFRVRGARLTVMSLERREPGRKRWNTWMVDDPLHWYAMHELVLDLPAGRLLVAGLGMGLFAHHLLERPDITDIEVIEIDPDVIALITPTLPEDPRVKITEGDYYVHIERGLSVQPDAVLWDLAVGDQEQTRPDFMRAMLMTGAFLPDVPLFCFGLRRTAGTACTLRRDLLQ